LELGRVVIARGRFGVVGLGALLLVLAMGGIAHAAVSFSHGAYPLPHADSAYHSTIGAIAVVDLNNDNRPDIVVDRGGGDVGKLYVLINNGDGTFAAAQPYDSCASSDGGTLVVGQFIGDAAPDVIAGCDTQVFREFLGKGDGTLGAGTDYENTGGVNTFLALWPGDNGALPEIIYPWSNQFLLCYKASNDLGATRSCPPDSSSHDVNGDPSGYTPVGSTVATAHFYDNASCPRDDLIMSPYQGSVRFWGLNPFGDPSPSHTVPPCSTYSETQRDIPLSPAVKLTGISAADLNGDGAPDLLLTDAHDTPGNLYALLWENGNTTVDGGFPAGEQPVVTPTISSLEEHEQSVADFDGDGHMDAAVLGDSSSTATLAVSRGHGDGSFSTPPDTFTVPGGGDVGGAAHLAVGDLNGDGRPDVVTAATYDDSVTVLLNTTGAGGPGGGPGGTPTRTLTVTRSGSGAGEVVGAGIDCGGGHVDCSETVANGTTVTLAATPAAGSTFGGFSGGGCAATSPCTVTMDADKTVGAAFVLKPTDPPGLANVCTQLRQVRGVIGTAFDKLIAQFPALAGKLGALRKSYVASIDGLLAKLGCVPAAKAAKVAVAGRAAAGPHLQVGTGRGDHLRGSARDDVQLGNGGADRLTGGRGRDLMLGGPGKDRLDGGPGADVAFGGSGNDRLAGGTGADLILGGSGKDTISARDRTRDYISCGPGNDRVTADKRDVVARDCEHVKRR
jgi:hypothetical protein